MVIYIRYNRSKSFWNEKYILDDDGNGSVEFQPVNLHADTVAIAVISRLVRANIGKDKVWFEEYV